jgi:uncharacterized membrane protein
VIAAAALGLWSVGGLDRMLVVVAALIYVLGVQMPTGMVNIPMNSRIQRLDVPTMTDARRRDQRERFERRWNQWNAFRTFAALFVTALLLVVLLRL